MLSKVATSSGLRDCIGVPNEYAMRTLPGISTWPGATDEDLPTQALHGRTASSDASYSEVQGAQVLHEDTATPILAHIAGKPGEAKDVEMQTPSPKPSEQRSSLSEEAVQQCHERGGDSSIVAHEPTHTTIEIAGKICTAARGDQGFVLKRKPLSFHLPPMNLHTPNISLTEILRALVLAPTASTHLLACLIIPIPGRSTHQRVKTRHTCWQH
jgi:hypothetical protein